MLFFLATPESSIVQTKTTKIRVHLSSGVAEIYEEHQDLMGRIDNDLVEFETNFDNKIETSKYLVQEGVFVVSTKNTISVDLENSETAVYVYAKRVFEISSKAKSSLDIISKEYETKTSLLEREEQRLKEEQATKDNKTSASYELVKSSNLMLLKEDVEFLRKVILVIKELK
uniref:ATP synthase CF1 epsilon subunit n=1 Tax=Synura uvella TaxID=52557 RepID=A0A3G2QZD2_9STRA|nr:ATP synthase CF1 epsilon subunit [Synura uvella]AYO28342.1 ATP synthase CF1 epsilon subunit [Synura uvella]